MTATVNNPQSDGGSGLPTDPNGNIIANIVPRRGTRANLQTVIGGAGELASTSDTPGIVKFTGGAIAGGVDVLPFNSTLQFTAPGSGANQNVTLPVTADTVQVTIPAALTGTSVLIPDTTLAQKGQVLRVELVSGAIPSLLGVQLPNTNGGIEIYFDGTAWSLSRQYGARVKATAAGINGSVFLYPGIYDDTAGVGNNRVVVGQAIATGNNAIAGGSGAAALNQNASAYGNNAKANASGSAAFGNAAQATGSGACAFGPNSAAIGQSSLALGGSNTQGAIVGALGDQATLSPTTGITASTVITATFTVAGASAHYEVGGNIEILLGNGVPFEGNVASIVGNAITFTAGSALAGRTLSGAATVFNTGIGQNSIAFDPFCVATQQGSVNGGFSGYGQGWNGVTPLGFSQWGTANIGAQSTGVTAVTLTTDASGAPNTSKLPGSANSLAPESNKAYRVTGKLLGKPAGAVTSYYSNTYDWLVIAPPSGNATVSAVTAGAAISAFNAAGIAAAPTVAVTIDATSGQMRVVVTPGAGTTGSVTWGMRLDWEEVSA